MFPLFASIIKMMEYPSTHVPGELTCRYTEICFPLYFHYEEGVRSHITLFAADELPWPMRKREREH